MDRVVDTLPLFQLSFFPVEDRMVAGGMVSHPVGDHFHQERLLLSDDVLSGVLDCLVHGQGVVAVDPEGGHAIGRTSPSDVVSTVLVLNRGGNGVFVVPAEEQGLAPKGRGEVQGGVEVSFAGCAFSEVGDCQTVLVADTVGVTGATGLGQLGGQGGGNSHAVEGLAPVMDSHLPSLGRVVVVAHALV